MFDLNRQAYYAANNSTQPDYDDDAKSRSNMRATLRFLICDQIRTSIFLNKSAPTLKDYIPSAEDIAGYVLFHMQGWDTVRYRRHFYMLINDAEEWETVDPTDSDEQKYREAVRAVECVMKQLGEIKWTGDEWYAKAS